MKQSISLVALLAIIPVGANAGLIYDENVTPDVIFGSGNANGAFTVDRNNGVELGLRAKLRHNASGQPENTFNSNGDGTYSFAAGVAPTQSFPTAVWSFEWSVNSAAWTGQIGQGGQIGQDGQHIQDGQNIQDGRVLSELIYELGIDSDPGLGTLYSTSDPINVFWADHAFGTNATGNGGGTEASLSNLYWDLIDNNNVAQNSQKADWWIDDFDPTVDGTYDIYLSASDPEDNELARTSIQVIVGNGATATVPVPAPLALFGLGLFLLGFARRFRKS